LRQPMGGRVSREKLTKYRGNGLSGPIQWYHALANLIWQDCRKI
jgi:hypothetical protein